MRTRIKANVLDAVTLPIEGATLGNNEPVVGGIVIPDLNGVREPAILVNGDQAYLFPINRVFTVVGGPNAGTYTVIAGVLGTGSQYNNFPAAPHIAGTTEIPVAAVPSTSAGGTIDGYGINSNDTYISDLDDPVDLQDIVTKNYVDNQIINIVLPLLQLVIPAGSVVSWSGTGAAPTGWLLCDGASYLTATYPDLSANIGTVYGTGANDFQVPDLRGRFPLGKSTGAGSFSVNRANAQNLAGIDGVEGVLLDTSEIPSHNHPGSTAQYDGAHDHTGSTNSEPNHTHRIEASQISTDTKGGGSRTANWVRNNYSMDSGFVDTEPNHQHPLTINNGGSHSHSLSINNTVGGDNAHNNVQPYVTIQYIIKT